MWASLCPPPQFEHKSVPFLQFLISQSGPAHLTHFVLIYSLLIDSWHLVQRKDVDSKYSLMLNCYQIVLNFEEDQLGRVGSLKPPMQALDPDFPIFHSHHRIYPTYPCLNFLPIPLLTHSQGGGGARVLVGQMYLKVFPKEILIPFCLLQYGVAPRLRNVSA